MAAPIIQQIVLDLRQAEAQLDALERQVAQLDQTITVPVQVDDSQLDQLQADLAGADETVDVSVEAPGAAQARQVFDELGAEIDQVGDELAAAQGRADALGDELKRTGDVGSSAFGSLRQSIGPLVATFAAGFGIRELVGQFNAAIDSATALSESINAVNVTFGDGADTVLEFGRNAAQSVGLASSEFNQLVVPLGALLSSFNLEGREAADAANELAVRASDLASVFNTDVTDALQAVGSALRGEQEPIRRYGVNLNQAAIDAKALELGLVGIGQEVDIAARGQAAYALILEQTAFAAGDFANTSDEVANRQRILAAETENARAAIGDALLPAYEAILDIAPPLIESLEDIGPLFGLIGEAAAAAVGGIQPFIQVVGEAVGAIGNLVGAVEDVPEGTSWIPDLGDLGQILNPLGLVSGLFLDIQDRLTRGFTDDALTDALANVASAAERTTDDVGLLTEVFERFSAEGLDIVPFLGEFADAATLTDQELERFLQNLLLSAEILGLTAAQIAGIRTLLRETGGDPTGGFGFGAIIDATPAVDAATSALQQFREAQDAVFNQATADSALRDRFADLPTVISDLDTLREAADDAGQSLQEFTTNVPDDVVINVDPALIAVGNLIDRLLEVQEILQESTSGGFADIEIPELEFDASGAVINLDEVRTAIQEQLAEQAAFEATLSEVVVDVGGVDLASFIQTLEPEVGRALAEAFALDQSNAQAAQDALSGALNPLGEQAATDLAETLRTATPAEIEALGVFAADNFVSNQIRSQLAESAGEIADVLEQSLAALTISPEITIDLSNAQITGAVNQGEIPIGGGFGDQPGQPLPPSPPTGGGGVQPVANFEVNINNPTTQDLESSAAQASQTIAAVSSSLWRAN